MKQFWIVCALALLGGLLHAEDKKDGEKQPPAKDKKEKAAPEKKNPDAAPAFELKDLDGKTHSLKDYRGKTVVLEWTNYGCPFVKKHYVGGNLPALQKKYTGKGVVWLKICSSAPGKQGHMTIEQWKEHSAKWKSAATAILLDPDGEVGKLYGAKTTPQMCVIDKTGVRVYDGALDDAPRARGEDIAKAKNYVVLALDAVLAGKESPERKTKPYGCSVKYKSPAQ